MDCLELFSNPTIIYHFELTYNIVIIIKKSNVLIIKGCALGIKRFSRILHLLESFLKVKCAHLSDLKVSILKTLCEKYSVNYNGLQCTDAMKLALINYFISLEKPEATVISDSLLVDSAVENVHFVEAYRKCEASNSESSNLGERYYSFPCS